MATPHIRFFILLRQRPLPVWYSGLGEIILRSDGCLFPVLVVRMLRGDYMSCFARWGISAAAFYIIGSTVLITNFNTSHPGLYACCAVCVDFPCTVAIFVRLFWGFFIILGCGKISMSTHTFHIMYTGTRNPLQSVESSNSSPIFKTHLHSATHTTTNRTEKKCFPQVICLWNTANPWV